MLAGQVVALPRTQYFRCDGCWRVVPLGDVVTLDLPDRRWVVACSRCYQAEPVGRWRGFRFVWDGNSWLPAWVKVDHSGGDGGFGGEGPPPEVSVAD